MIISSLEKKHKISWVITIIIATTIFFLSSINFETYEGAVNSISKSSIIYHFLSFFFLSFFLLIASIKGKNWHLFWLSISIAILYGILDEIHQIFVPGRFFDTADIIINFAGIFYSGLIYLWRGFINFK